MDTTGPQTALAQEPLIRAGIVPNIPNALSLLRLLSAPFLLVLAIAGRERPFRWLLVASLLTDIADGIIARRLQITSKVGAMLDSTADLLVFGTAVYAIFRLRSAFVSEHYGPILALVGLYLMALAAGLLRYSRLASFHTHACRIAAYAQGIFVVLLLFRGYEPALFYLMIGVSALAYMEEFALTFFLPKWTANVGGLYWVLRHGRS
jgi:phosphatidylglycerophosphate synthase